MHLFQDNNDISSNVPVFTSWTSLWHPNYNFSVLSTESKLLENIHLHQIQYLTLNDNNVNQFVFVTAADALYVPMANRAIATVQRFFPGRKIIFYDLNIKEGHVSSEVRQSVSQSVIYVCVGVSVCVFVCVRACVCVCIMLHLTECNLKYGISVLLIFSLRQALKAANPTSATRKNVIHLYMFFSVNDNKTTVDLSSSLHCKCHPKCLRSCYCKCHCKSLDSFVYDFLHECH